MALVILGCEVVEVGASPSGTGIEIAIDFEIPIENTATQKALKFSCLRQAGIAILILLSSAVHPDRLSFFEPYKEYKVI